MTQQLAKIEKGFFLDYQIKWIKDASDAMLSEKSRRIGMTYADSYKSCRDRNMIDHRRDLWFSSADESAAYEYALYCRTWCEIMEAATSEILETLEDERGYKYNNYVVEFPNGSRINCMSSNPRRFRSKGGDVVLDEFAWHDDPEGMLDAAMPTTTWGFQLRILSTHNGETSRFNRIISAINKVLRGDATYDELRLLHYTLHRTTIIDAVEQGLAEKVFKLDHISPEHRDKFIKSCRARCKDEDAWNQEYMCIPSSGESTLIPYDLYQSCEDANCLTMIPTGPLFVGVDVGREKDLTVFWVAEQVGDVLVTRQIIRLHKAPYEVQHQTGSELLRRSAVQRMAIDATGIGDPVCERLQSEFGEVRVQKVKFTSQSKDHMASLVLGRFQDKRARVPDDWKVREAFHKIKKTVTGAGGIRYDAVRTDEGHADEFWAFGLACEAAHNPTEKPELIFLGA
jgi:phage FluMu gp28-like protein